MQTAVLGTGAVGRAWATRLVELGHGVVVGTRDPAASRERDPGWPDLELAPYAKAVVGADLVVNALSGAACVNVLTGLAPLLEGRVLMDIANPLDFSAGFPPTLFIKDTDSLGEQLQRALPGTRVVKAVNTLNASLQVRPPKEGSVFVAGNDDEAKAVVTGLLADVGHRDIIDLGDISGSRGVEMFLPLWLRLMGVLRTAEFTVKVVRPAESG